MKLGRTVVAALVAAGLANAPAEASALTFRTIARGDGASSALTDRGVRVVRSARQWDAAWRQLHAGTLPTPRRPRVDFGRHMVVLVTAGRKPTAGYGVRVSAVADRGDRLRVSAVERVPGDECVAAQVLTAPFVAVRVRRGRESATLARRVVRSDC